MERPRPKGKENSAKSFSRVGRRGGRFSSTGGEEFLAEKGKEEEGHLAEGTHIIANLDSTTLKERSIFAPEKRGSHNRSN